MNATHLTHAAEIYSADPDSAGPTGEFAEVLEGCVQDYGGNVLYGPAHPDACVLRLSRFRVPTRLVPTKWRAVENVAGAETTWRLVATPNSQ